MRIDQGGTARFYCDDNSETTSTITWMSETGDLPKEATTNRGVLTIQNVHRRHSGLYTCIGSNQHSTDRVTVQLKVGGKVIKLLVYFLTLDSRFRTESSALAGTRRRLAFH